MQKRKSHRPWEFFNLSMVLFSVLMLWILSNGYHSDYSLHLWAKILAHGSGGGSRLEDIGILFPPVPLGLLWPIVSIPGLHTEYMSYLLSILAAGFVFAHWNLFLVKRGYKIKERLMFVCLVILHPFTLWGITSGINNAFTFCFFYLYCFGIVRLVLIRDIHSVLFMSSSLLMLFLTDDRSLYLAIVMFPFIPLIAPERMLKESLASVYVILLMPFGFALLAWMYMGWMFHSDAFMFMHAPEAMFNGVWQTSDQYAWLNQWGGEWLASIGYTILLSMLVTPAIIWIIFRYRKHQRVFHTVPKLFLMPAIAAGIGTVGFALFHAVDILFMQIAVLMTIFLLLPRLRGKSLWIVLVLLLLGNIGGWWVMQTGNAPQLDNWRNSLLHTVTSSKSDQNLAKFLDEQPYDTLIDHRAAYKVIAAKGNVDHLILPFKLEVKLVDKFYLDTVEQFATLNPSHADGVVDVVGRKYEGIYWGGLAGYQLVYDDQKWRVYRRNDINPLAGK